MIGFLLAAAIAVTPQGTIVAHDRSIELHADTRVVWRANGVANPSLIATSATKAAAIDSLANEAAIADLATGRTTFTKTGETPIDALFASGQLYILNRDSHTLQRGSATIDVAPDPAFLRESRGMLFVYSRRDGVLQEIRTEPFAIRRRLTLAPFASDMQVDARYAYFTYPRAGKVVTVDLTNMKRFGEQKVGAVPISLAVLSRTIAVADPSAKRVWMFEGAQTLGQAVTRGFVRGLLGLGLFSNRNSQFLTGVDRVLVRGSTWLAYDSATGTLYRFSRSNATPIAQRVGPRAFAITSRGIVWWDDTALRLQKKP